MLSPSRRHVGFFRRLDGMLDSRRVDRMLDSRRLDGMLDSRRLAGMMDFRRPDDILSLVHPMRVYEEHFLEFALIF